jgi:hypothetical protein
MTSAVVGALKTFGRFWWEFLVGDTPDLFLATLVIVGVAFALRGHRVAGAVVLPLLAIAMLLGSTYRGRRRTTAAAPAPADHPETDDEVVDDDERS